ncbi:MAG: beta-lactamase family protein [Phycisphaerales bacterium]|nr:beta-lactamase family protein [Phycisphaerales bacterium]
MRRSVLAVVCKTLAIILFIPLASPVHGDLQDLRQWMQAQVESGNVVGCSAQVTQEGETIFEGAFGRRSPESSDALETDQIVRIYSMSKAITSAAVMQLVEQGKIGIDDPVSMYLPEFERMQVGLGEDARPPRRSVTIRDLLTHTSGLAYDFSASPSFKGAYEGIFKGKQTLDEASEAMATLPLLHDPGESFTYGLNTDVLGAVVEEVGQQPFGEYLQANIFEPLGMHSTMFTPPADLELMHIVTGTPGSLKVDESHYGDRRHVALKPRFESGGGGLWSTLNDYTRFMQAMEQGGQLDGVRILRPETVAFMTQNHLSPAIDSPMRFGLGFGLNPPVETAHGPRGGGRWTWGGAASTYFFIDPDQDLTAVFITQKFPFDFMLGDAFHREVLESVAAAEVAAAGERTPASGR